MKTHGDAPVELLAYTEHRPDGRDWYGMRDPENHRTFLETTEPVEIRE